MSAPLINRSLTTIRTELEFLHDSEIIDEQLYNKLINALPHKYQNGMQPWGVEKLESTTGSTDKLAAELESTKISAPPSEPPSRSSAFQRPQAPKPLGFCTVLFDYQAQEADDLNLKKDEKVAIVDHLSEDWWKGYTKDQPQRIGVFPSNYVKSISESEFNISASPAIIAPPSSKNEKSEYKAEDYSYPAPQQQYHPPYQAQGYSAPPQYPPPTTNFYQQAPEQQQQMVPQQGGNDHPHLRKFGSKLGNAAIFGAGATIGSDIVNSIF
ncbi:protein that induces appearance of [PIN+] prion when overproduced [Yamadazyma tenuis]|uniref:SH3-domain-containing protein n=1 Tax=Candida tenuis (strain ATCC 10573 / BCRC 21748 / CBS 615 / JCM 9827 / NBRC 10315 / NRRL Y-1498 / VKM Y-70) TaxID=590646 RepID=G3B8T4_CANTC|nr:SH3-domain-containing protein [Yamadazyma tenuis ATCC 10573]XP_006689090.1 uncharacterized protein CANTEDRAFT_115888 [Yamadazyma tenuis ATCC 10573]EGV62919.1 SH3-domain-containing protein [Yamadazyma tenuis ATCC 10573]EGV62920.1 hypothetical protein CANTEDRAFT_115888 [Yamadazyma tenuis ATCC 10573]WEJ93705.1 protein that induces appearance of [PIN+] prion when overproduced [Yamadazyma tenuis]